MPSAELSHRLSQLSHDQLVDLVVDLAEDPAVARRVAVALDGLTGGTVALARAVDEVLRSRRRFSDYRAVLDYATQARPVVDALQRAAAGPAARDLVPIVERAIGHVVKVLHAGDDSAGAAGDVAQALLTTHAEAAAAGRPDTNKLVRWLVRFTFETQDFFIPDVRDYASALGEPGIAQYRTEVARRAAADPEAFAPQHAQQRLALLDRDAEAVVRLFGGDLQGVHRYVAVAKALREIGRDDEALAWARRGMALPATWQSRGLYDVAAAVLADRGDRPGLVALRQEGLSALPDTTSLSALREAAVVSGRWAELRAPALRALAERAPEQHLLALLADDDVDAAWTVLHEHPAAAVSEQTAQRVAARRGSTHPQDAIPYVRRAVEQSLTAADRRAYRTAATLLRELRLLHSRAGTPAGFVAYVAALAEQHRRRPSLLDELRKAGLLGQDGRAR